MKRVIFLEQNHQCTSHRRNKIGKGIGTGIAQRRGGRLGLAGDDTQSRSASQDPARAPNSSTGESLSTLLPKT